MTRNQIEYHNALETERHNKMMEQETQRHQKADESLRAQANAIQQEANAIQARQVAINALHYDRSDTETQRSHQAQESLTAAQNAIQQSIAQETQRHNTATEWITRSLNSSIITKNAAEAGTAFRNLDFIQARTNAENARVQQIKAQTRTESAKTQQTVADTELSKQQHEIRDYDNNLFSYWYRNIWIPAINAAR